MSELTDALHIESEALCEQETATARLWEKGFTRRKFMAGVGMLSAAALSSQLVTSRVSFASAGASTNNDQTVITIFLRGAADGLRMLVPASSALGLDYLMNVRADLVPSLSTLLPLTGSGGWALNPGFAPLLPYWASNELSFIPAVSAPGITRSHFQAQALLERGGSSSASTGWLDRTLQGLGPGTTFRALADGFAEPISMVGDQPKVGLKTLSGLTYGGWGNLSGASQTAMLSLYRGFNGPLGEDVPIAFSALSTASSVAAAPGPLNGAVYPTDDFGKSLSDIAKLLRAEVGLQVATVDVGGWDTHTLEAATLDSHIASLSKSLNAFMQDLGPTRRSRVTVVVMTEFGRRVAQNANLGADHGHGSVMMLLGAGLKKSTVGGLWSPLSDAVLDQGDVPGLNSAFDVLSEVVTKRLALSTNALPNVFPGRTFSTPNLLNAAAS